MDREDILILLITALINLVLTFIVLCGFVWLVCYILGMFGVVAQFSMKLVFAVWAVFIIIKFLFKGVSKE